jgi:hypothetical protein
VGQFGGDRGQPVDGALGAAGAVFGDAFEQAEPRDVAPIVAADRPDLVGDLVEPLRVAAGAFGQQQARLGGAIEHVPVVAVAEAGEHVGAVLPVGGFVAEVGQQAPLVIPGPVVGRLQRQGAGEVLARLLEPRRPHEELGALHVRLCPPGALVDLRGGVGDLPRQGLLELLVPGADLVGLAGGLVEADEQGVQLGAQLLGAVGDGAEAAVPVGQQRLGRLKVAGLAEQDGQPLERFGDVAV